jgi:hypothetical protein
LTCAQLFAICNLSGQEIDTEKKPWPYIINELNRAEDIIESSKIKHLLKVSSLIRLKDAPPTKEDLLILKSNRARLLLINILIERKKYLWAEDIFNQIDSRKLNAIECRLLFELETIFILKFPDSENSLNLQESLNSLIKVCGPELKLNPGHLVDLFQFYVNKQLLAEALVIADILWKDDEYHFHCGQLHQKSYRIRWESKDTYHWQKAKDHFEIIEQKFPKSHYLTEAYTSLIVLNSEIESASFLDKMMREKLFPIIEKVAPENIANILDAFSNKAPDPIIIQLLKDWYHLLLEKKAALLGEEMIVTFLIEKCGLTLNDLVLFLNNGESNNKISSRLKNASLQKEIQFLVYWNSEWVPITDFQSAATEFRYDATTKTPYLISKNKQNQPISFSYIPQKTNCFQIIYLWKLEA